MKSAFSRTWGPWATTELCAILVFWGWWGGEGRGKSETERERETEIKWKKLYNLL